MVRRSTIPPARRKPRRVNVPVAEPQASSQPTLARKRSLPVRLWIYQRERFPVVSHGALIAAFSFCMVSYSGVLRGVGHIPDWKVLLVAFVTAFIFFLQMRIADEFKDFDEDSCYRPYRPVPRGIVSLHELGVLGLIGGAVQLGLALWLSPALLPFLLGTWLYLGLMTREFFVGPWLKKHPITYMWTHMLIIPLIDIYGTACDWAVAGVMPSSSLLFLIGVSFFNGFALEIGRKIRSPKDEEFGVETYSFLWGRGRAIAVWCVALLVTAVCVVLAAHGFVWQEALLFGSLLVTASVIALQVWRKPLPGRGKWIELFSGTWTLLVYVSLGILPLLWQWLTRGVLS